MAALESKAAVEAGGNMVFAWIARYGIAAVFATLLLGYMLWQNYVTQERELVLIQQTNTLLTEQNRTLADMSRQQRETAIVLDQVRQALAELDRERRQGPR